MKWLDGGQATIRIDEIKNDEVMGFEMASQMNVTALFDAKWMTHLVIGEKITLKHFSVVWKESVCFDTTIPGAQIFLHCSHLRGAISVADLFAGIGGWDHGLKMFGTDTRVFVEHHEETCKILAATFSCEVLSPEQAFEKAIQRNFPEKAVICGKVQSPLVWQTLGLLNVGWCLASPPCQPWSEAGKLGGLAVEDGAVFLVMLENATLISVFACLVENVVGFAKHRDHNFLISEAERLRFRLVIAGIFKASNICPINRDRWLGSFICEDVFHKTRVNSSQALSLCQLKHVVDGIVLSLTGFDALHVHMHEWEKVQLIPDDCALKLLGDIDLLPQRYRSQNLTNEESVRAARSINADCPLPCAMAAYGRQHLLPKEHLDEKKLHTYLLYDGEYRYVSPWEVLACMCFPFDAKLCDDISLAWQVVGNAISPVHAALQIFKTEEVLKAPYQLGIKINLEKALQKLLQQKINLSSGEVVRDQSLLSFHEFKGGDIPSPERKKAKHGEVSPTVSFDVVEETGLYTTNMVSSIIAFKQSHLNDKPDGHCMGGLVVFKHVHGTWMVVAFGRNNSTVEQFMCNCLPHAKEDHFNQMTMNGEKVFWKQNIQAQSGTTIVFEPVIFKVTCDAGVIGRWTFGADVTWTIRSLQAFVASKIVCIPDVISMSNQGLPTQDDDFVLEFQDRSFKVDFKTFTQPSTGQGKLMEDKQQALRPADSGIFRVAVKHPVSKVVRTVACRCGDNLFQVVRNLLPDIAITCAWTLFTDHDIVGDTTIGNLVNMSCFDFQIQWDCLRPLEVSTVFLTTAQVRIDSHSFERMMDGFSHHQLVERWIRTPFHVKAQAIRIPGHWSLCKVASFMVAHTQIDATMICHEGSALIDPTCKVENTREDGVLGVRLCPLRGGAKDGFKDKLKKSLVERGVPSGLVDDRAAKFIAKVPAPETQGLLGLQGESEFWGKIKNLANQYSFRLILHTELKEHQKLKRSAVKPASSYPVKSRKSEELDLGSVVIQPHHFWDGDENVQILEKARFGPDQCGLAIMPTKELAEHIKNPPKSVDGLAILGVGKDAEKFGTPLSIPAMREGSPLVVKACLVQFGDREIEYKAAIPDVKIKATPSTVIEFTIVKALTKNWKDCAVPLHYIGIHVPPLRGTNLLGVWAVKSYNDCRENVDFEKAIKWHGFMKVLDTLLPQILGRSGHAGIFMVPKGEDRKPDQRYGIVVLPNCSLAETLNKASEVSQSLGVCKVGGHYAVRSLREHVSILRSHLLPETACVEAGNFDDSDILFIIKGTPNNITGKDLGMALEAQGWDAVAVRPQGQNSWLLAAKKAPDFCHVSINGALASVEANRKNSVAAPVTMFAKEVQVQAMMNAQTGQVAMSQTTRFAEVRQELQVQIAQAINVQMAEANQKIEFLANALQETQKAAKTVSEETKGQLTAMQSEQAFMKQRVGEVENAITASSNAMLNKMQSMFTSFQSNFQTAMTSEVQALGGRLQEIENKVEETKRPRKDHGGM